MRHQCSPSLWQLEVVRKIFSRSFTDLLDTLKIPDPQEEQEIVLGIWLQMWENWENENNCL